MIRSLLAVVLPVAGIASGFVPDARAGASAPEPAGFLGLAHVGIRVGSLEQARHFYRDAAGFEEAFDALAADGSVRAAYFKVNDLQFIEIIPGLDPKAAVPMREIAIRTDRLEVLRSQLEGLGLHPGAIRTDPDGSLGFEITDLPGQRLDALEFIQYGPGSLATRDRGKHLGGKKLSAHLEHAGIIATDFDKAYRFYADTLGFHETWRRLTTDRGRVVIDHIAMPGSSGDFVELSNLEAAGAALGRTRAGSAAHFALEVSDIQAVAKEILGRDGALRRTPPHYGLDNRWNFNVFDSDGTRMEFMQTVDPAHPTPAVAVTPADFGKRPTSPK